MDKAAPWKTLVALVDAKISKSGRGRRYLRSKGVKDGIIRKKPKGKGLRESLKRKNKANSSPRAGAEFPFNTVKRIGKQSKTRFGGGVQEQGAVQAVLRHVECVRSEEEAFEAAFQCGVARRRKNGGSGQKIAVF